MVQGTGTRLIVCNICRKEIKDGETMGEYVIYPSGEDGMPTTMHFCVNDLLAPILIVAESKKRTVPTTQELINDAESESTQRQGRT